METQGVGATMGARANPNPNPHLEMYSKDGGADGDGHDKMKRLGVWGSSHLRLNPLCTVQQHQSITHDSSLSVATRGNTSARGASIFITTRCFVSHFHLVV